MPQEFCLSCVASSDASVQLTYRLGWNVVQIALFGRGLYLSLPCAISSSYVIPIGDLPVLWSCAGPCCCTLQLFEQSSNPPETNQLHAIRPSEPNCAYAGLLYETLQCAIRQKGWNYSNPCSIFILR
jgi:hypothetical protein